MGAWGFRGRSPDLALSLGSAGVGRTGVFITLSIVLERMRYEGVVDMFQTVKTLRTQRPAMVQTEVCRPLAMPKPASHRHMLGKAEPDGFPAQQPCTGHRCCAWLPAGVARVGPYGVHYLGEEWGWQGEAWADVWI